MISVLVGLLFLASFVSTSAGEGPQRVDLFRNGSERLGYAIVDPKDGRFDLFDARSRRLGSGTLDASGTPSTLTLKDGSLVPGTRNDGKSRPHRGR